MTFGQVVEKWAEHIERCGIPVAGREAELPPVTVARQERHHAYPRFPQLKEAAMMVRAVCAFN